MASGRGNIKLYIAFPEEAASRFEEGKKYVMYYIRELLTRKPYLLFHFLIAYVANALMAKHIVKDILLDDVINVSKEYGFKSTVLSRTPYMTVVRLERGE